MATSMKVSEIQASVKANAVEFLGLEHEKNGVVQYGANSFAIPVTLDGKEYYAKVEITCASWKDTKTSPAFDPIDARNDYLDLLDERAKAREIKARAKAKKLAKQS